MSEATCRRPVFDRSSRRRREPRRRGAILVVALVVLLVVTAIVGSMVKRAVAARRQLRTERDLRQTELLVDAGAARAAVRLAADGDYRGETWRLKADDILGLDPGEVTIKVSQPAGERAWTIRVIAEYPAGRETSVRRTRTFSRQPLQPQSEE